MESAGFTRGGFYGHFKSREDVVPPGPGTTEGGGSCCVCSRLKSGMPRLSQIIELGGLPGEFFQFANSIRSELSAVSVLPLKESAQEPNGDPG
jgi:hypothetical protein